VTVLPLNKEWNGGSLMKKNLLKVNTCCYLIIAAYLLITVSNAVRSGFPWAMTCYSCLLCRQSCPLGIDPHGFISAANTDDPNLYVTASNIRIHLNQAIEIDPDMQVRFRNQPVVKAKTALAQGIEPEAEVTVLKMHAKDAASFCPLCGNCNKACPITLPLMKIIEDLKDDGEFNG